MLAVTAVLICAKDFSVGKITAIKVKRSLDSIDFKKEFDNGKSLFLKKKYSRAQENFNKVVIGAIW